MEVRAPGPPVDIDVDVDAARRDIERVETDRDMDVREGGRECEVLEDMICRNVRADQSFGRTEVSVVEWTYIGQLQNQSRLNNVPGGSAATWLGQSDHSAPAPTISRCRKDGQSASPMTARCDAKHKNHDKDNNVE